MITYSTKNKRLIGVNSVVTANPNPSAGGRNGDEIEEIRNNALYAHSSQLRAVTKNDYIVRSLSLPSDYGSISKVYVTQDLSVEDQATTAPTMTTNPLSLDLYVLAYNADKNLIKASTTLKQNLATYLNEYRMVTDAINIRDAFYINIGVNFDITTISGFNNQLVLKDCINTLKSYFNIESWQINRPIILSEVMVLLLQVKGVQSVVKLEIINKEDSTGQTYSDLGYDISGATRNGNIYTSSDPSIFEVRYPDTDIQGRVVTY
jgi:RNase P/RNase MRP subunit p29